MHALAHARTRGHAALVVAFVLAASCIAGTAAGATERPTQHVGIFIPRVTNGSIVSTPAQTIAEARSLGVETLRVEQNLSAPISSQATAFAAAGFDLVLTLRASPAPGAAGKATVFPPHTPEHLAEFRADLGRTLDATHPALLAVENEEVGSPFVSGSVDDYLAELAAAIAVGHVHHVPVTNGGITSNTLALLTWKDLHDRGKDASADDFARRAFADPKDRIVLADLLAPTFTGLHSQHLTDALTRGTELVAAYRKLPLDYVNFHWYIDDSTALRDSVTFLRKATGHDVVTHEIGQHSVDPSVVTNHLKTLDDLDLPFVIWFDADGMPALGLHDQTGQLRANGDAFAGRS